MLVSELFKNMLLHDIVKHVTMLVYDQRTVLSLLTGFGKSVTQPNGVLVQSGVSHILRCPFVQVVIQYCSCLGENKRENLVMMHITEHITFDGNGESMCHSPILWKTKRAKRPSVQMNWFESSHRRFLENRNLYQAENSF